MSLIAVWSPLRGGSGSTMLATSLPIVLAFEYQVKVLLAHGGYHGERVEQAFTHRKETLDYITAFQDSGMDALDRLDASGRLSPENVRNYTLPLLSDRLDLLCGPRHMPEHEFESAKHAEDGNQATLMNRVMESSKRSYDVTIADAGNGAPGASDRAILQGADLIVVALNQNLHALERELVQERLPSELTDKHRLYVIGKYDRESNCTLQNIKRRFGIKNVVLGVPYCSGMTDAWNMRSILPYMQRSRGGADLRRMNPLYNAVHHVADAAAEQLGLPAGASKAGGLHAFG
ncbi:hypothetical protein M2277_002744 [Paenibacillus sp. LBL]|uniref:hypothetical protein n=1 Tax=Paenibacillus TaxID=44249 RepID=UPI00096DC260|nr:MULTISPECIES: hypothetical protein [Paenibacillus]MDH6672082.1 hypothetical protein [Paenibacillus sp. LBL]OMF67127.1 hypothetical protein BK142_28145 [Paenibacillus glucanolyticus]